MTAKAETVGERLTTQQLKALIVRQIFDLGHACAPDLAGQIGSGTTKEQLVPILESLVDEGVLRHVKEPKDHRDYKGPYQVRYELPL